jgi:ParB family chromosome partitioning protein
VAKLRKPETRSHFEVAIGELDDASKNLEAAGSELRDIQSSGNLEIQLVDLNDIHEIQIFGSSMHNRTGLKSELIASLAERIKLNKPDGLFGTGLMHPIVLRRNNSRLERIAGSRRVLAFKENEESHIPAVILEGVSDEKARLMRSSENEDREPENPYDELMGILELLALLLKQEGIEQIKSFLHKASNVMRNKSTFSVEEQELYTKAAAIIREKTKYSIPTLADRLSILNMKKAVVDAMIRNELSFMEAKLISRGAKNDHDADILIRYVQKVHPTNNELSAKIESMKSAVMTKKESINLFDVAKAGFGNLGKRQYKSLGAKEKERADGLLRDINQKIEMLHEVLGGKAE